MKKEKFVKKIKLPLLVLLSNLLACNPLTYTSKPDITEAYLTDDLFITSDGTELPLKKWPPSQQTIKNVLIALHGFNDYSNFFQQPGNYFSQQNIISYAYDQRGFGNTLGFGSWASIETYTSDLASFIQLVRNKHPDIPLFLLGESMGAAVIISTLSQYDQLPIAGVILVAPAVWGRKTMPWYQNMLLWTLSRTTPGLALTTKHLHIKPSDNIEMLKALHQDPLVIKATRIGTLYGLTNLMDHALSTANLISTKTLLLYGEKDEIIPKKPMYLFLHNLTKDVAENHHMIAFYKNGYHLLLRDLEATVLWNDIDVWINANTTALPSGADKRAQLMLGKLRKH